MNLIEVQDDLRSLPNDPRTMQMLTAYANGANPEVPPYVALGELNRRKQLMERAQAQAAGQPPQQSIKDQMTQSAGIMALQGGRQQQAQQQMMQQMAQRQQIPPQMQQQGPVQAARGGLLSRLMGYPTARYRSGGIVSFQSGTEGTVGDEEVRQMMDAGYNRDEEEERRREELIRRMSEAQDVAYGGEQDGSARSMLLRAMEERARRSEEGRPKFIDPLAERERIIKERPELAAATADTSAEMLRRFDEMQALRRAEFEKQREEMAKARPGLFSQLAAGAAQNRGRSGGDALAAMLGGYAQVARKQRETEAEQERGMRGRELELQQARMQVLNKIDEEKRARAEGDLKLAMKAKMDHEKILRDYNTSDNQLFGRELSAIGQLATTEERERGMLEREGLRQEALTDRAQLLRGREALAQRIAALRAEGKNAEADQLAEAYRSMGGASTALVGEYNSARNLILAQIKIQQNIIDSKGSNRATPQEKEKAKLEKQRLEGVLAQLPIPGLPASSAPTPAAAPAASPSAPLGTAANPIKLK